MRILVTNRAFNCRIHDHRIGNWKYSAEHGYAWNGGPMKPDEFNQFTASPEWRRQIEAHGAMISIQCVQIRDMAKAREAAKKVRESEVATAQ